MYKRQSLAKRFEEVFVPHSDVPVEVPRGSDALFLLQRIRDESHRFAIGYHRTLREKRSTASVLDDVAGLGPTRKRRLLDEAGGITKLRAAEPSELRAFSWLPEMCIRDRISAAGRAVGMVTSAADGPAGPLALGYVKTAALNDGAALSAGGIDVVVVV